MGAAEDRSDQPDLKQQVTYPLARLSAKLTAQATRLLRSSSSLTVSQWRLMVILDAWGEASLAEVTRFLDFDKGQMSRVSQGLIQAGLLAATRSQDDQRRQLLSLTKAGRAEFDRAAPQMQRRRSHLFDALSPEERAQFQHIMEVLHKAADAFDAADKDAP